MVLVWAVLFAGAMYAIRRHTVGAVVCAIAVLSHWVLDLIVHHPDLPLLPGAEGRYGLGLWSSRIAALAWSF